MERELQITFRNMERSAAIEDKVREKAKRLEKFAERMVGCQVVVEAPHQHHRKGNLYLVRIDVTMPGGRIAVNRESGQHREYKEIGVALRDAFDTARRQLEDYTRRQNGAVKVPAAAAHARVTRLFPEEGYGFIETPDHREVYFHRKSVVGDGFERLKIGSEVSFVEQLGQKGPQASTVKLVGKHGHAGLPGAKVK